MQEEVQMTTILKVCANDRCNNLVPMSRNPGVERKFCSARCRQRYHARMQYQREAGSEGVGMVRIATDGKVYVHRTMAPTAALSQKRFLAHNENCAITGGKRCPATVDDAHDHKRKCLVHAVLQDDWRQRMREEDGRGAPFRLRTTQSGRWLTDFEAEQVERVYLGMIPASELPSEAHTNPDMDAALARMVAEGQELTSGLPEGGSEEAPDVELDVDQVVIDSDIDREALSE